MSVTEYLEDRSTKPSAAGAQDLFPDPTLAPRILMTIFGAHLTYKPFRFEGEDICLRSYRAGRARPKPTPGYQGAIGRSFTQLTANWSPSFPALLGNTWRADNLSKIDHIVVVMMENRSYDHVLGYRAQALISMMAPTA